MAEIEVIHSSGAPEAVGPYSQAVAHGGLLYLSGQIGLVPAKGALAGDTIEAQTEQVTRNLTAVLAEAGASVADILKINIYLTDMADFPVVNGIYADWLGEHRPARATVQVDGLPLGAKVEMDLVAVGRGA